MANRGLVPEGIRCFDRWANPLPQAPVEAARSLVYLVAEGNEGAAILRAALEEVPSPKSVSTTPEMLFDTVLQALVTGSPPLWSLCSVQGSAAYAVGPDGPVAATRTMLQRSGKERGTRFARYVLDACITDVAARHPGNKSISGL